MYARFVANSIIISVGYDEPEIVGIVNLNYRIPIETWYLPSVVGIISLLVGLFTYGVVKDIKAKKIRIALLRVPVFLLILYLAIFTVSVPFKINKNIERIEEEYVSEQLDAETPENR